VWNSDLPRPLQQILFDTAVGVTPPPASSPPAAARPGHLHAAETVSGPVPALRLPALIQPRASRRCPRRIICTRPRPSHGITEQRAEPTGGWRPAEWVVCVLCVARRYHGDSFGARSDCRHRRLFAAPKWLTGLAD
jgi:hypothetical protein